MSQPLARLARRTPPTRWALAALVLMVAVVGCATRDPWGDARIESEVKARLVAKKDADLTRLGVVSRKGVVHLSGVVNSPEQKEQASALAKDVRGVSGVINSVTVQSGAPSTSSRSP